MSPASTCIHTFEAASLLGSRPAAAITVIAQSPAIDVLGIGFANGTSILFDVRMGEVLGRVRLEGEGAGEVAALSFRTDNEAQTLAVASTSGHVALFDLASEMKLLHLVRNAHEGPVGGLEWVPGQPLMVTSGGDNSVKVRLPVLSREGTSLTLKLPLPAAMAPRHADFGTSPAQAAIRPPCAAAFRALLR